MDVAKRPRKKCLLIAASRFGIPEVKGPSHQGKDVDGFIWRNLRERK
jgi:hypothetical protein